MVKETSEMPNKLPRHVAVIMDGNGRWAKQRNLPRVAGHKAGVKSVQNLVEQCVLKKIEVLTLFAFSSENWKRPEQEVGTLMELFFTTLNGEAKKLHKNKVQLRFIGDRQAFSEKLQKKIHEAEKLTSQNTGLVLVIAANYGGRWDITQAAKALAQQVADGSLSVDEITPEKMHAEVCMSDLPEPDLFIRTSGEYRISNYLLWQLAYSELYFTDTYWPDFDSEAFAAALDSFSNRQRRFGLTGEQLEQQKHA